MSSVVIAVSRSAQHTFSKPNQTSINLIKGLGVEGDAHAGKKVKHRFLVKRDATKPNLRQVHLIHAELLDTLNASGFAVAAGQLGENITTRGLYLLGLPTGATLHIGSDAIIALTGLRNPCIQIDQFQKGVLKAVLGQDEQGNLIRKAGVMGIVLASGVVRPGDAIVVKLPPAPHWQLEYTG